MKVLIIDDEPRQLNYLEKKIQKHCPEVKEIEKLTSPVDGLKHIKNKAFDLLFLDVEMPEMTGFEFIEIVGVDKVPPVIFTTAYSKYAVEAFKVNAIDYLLKPVDPEELKNAVKKVSSTKRNQSGIEALLSNQPETLENRIVLTEGQTYLFVRPEEIIYVQGSGSYSTFYLSENRKVTTSKRLNYYWQRLSEKIFIRPHQSFLVNQSAISGYDKANGGELILNSNLRVPVSRRMKEEIKILLKV